MSLTDEDSIDTRLGVMDTKIRELLAIKKRLEERVRGDGITITLLESKCAELRARIQKLETR